MPNREAAGGFRELPLTYFSLAQSALSLLLLKALGEKARWVIPGSRLLSDALGHDRVKFQATFVPVVTRKSGSPPGPGHVRRIR
jgi:hypothetical protein